MDLETYLSTRPYIDNKQALLTSYEFTPTSALLSLLGIIAPFTIQPVSILSFITLCSPLFINFHSYVLGGALIMIVICSQLIIGDGDMIINLILILDGLYIIEISNVAFKDNKLRITYFNMINSLSGSLIRDISNNRDHANCLFFKMIVCIIIHFYLEVKTACNISTHNRD